MANFDETGTQSYDWDQEGVYVVEKTDPVEGGVGGVSNRQGKTLARRTRNLHERLGELTTAVDVNDAETLHAAKEYADAVVVALVNGSPEALNTLQELAKALGNDANFATTVMNEIGKRATTEAMNAGLAGKFDKTGGTLTGAVSVAMSGGTLQFGRDANGTFINNIGSDGVTKVQLRLWDNGRATLYDQTTKQFTEIWHSGNFDPASRASVGQVTADTSIANIPFAAPNVAQVHVSGVEYAAMLTMVDWAGTQLQLKMKDYAGQFKAHIRGSKTQQWYELYHSGNFNPATKADAGHGHAGVEGLHWWNVEKTSVYTDHYLRAVRMNPGNAATRLQLYVNGIWYDMVSVSAADSVPWSGVTGKPLATPTADGLMSAGDKAKLDGIGSRVVAAGTVYYSGGSVASTGSSGRYDSATKNYVISYPETQNPVIQITCGTKYSGQTWKCIHNVLSADSTTATIAILDPGNMEKIQALFYFTVLSIN